MNAIPNTFALFAVTAPGLAPWAARELQALGFALDGVESGGVAFRGPREAIYRANLWLRTANRVLARAGEFPAQAFYELDKRARRVPWEHFLLPGQPVHLRVTCRKSRLYHSDAVAERVGRAIEARLGGAGAISVSELDEAEEDTEAVGNPPHHAQPLPAVAGDEAGEGTEAQPALVVVRLLHDQCTLSVDTSGALLHRRGYRLETGKAPLRETLAAAAALASGWATGDRDTAYLPLIDPLCGSGTLAIEAALIARNMAPGLGRRFAFMDGPDFDVARWQALAVEAQAAALPTTPGRLQASDRDAGAVAAARANAERAGLAGEIEFGEHALSAITPPHGPGWLLANPPYGVRVGERDRLRNLYAQIGHVARQKLPGWTVALLSADEDLVAQVRLPYQVALRTVNGGIPVALFVMRA